MVAQLQDASRRDTTALAALAGQSADEARLVWRDLFPEWLRRPPASLHAAWGGLLAGLAPLLDEDEADAALRALLQAGRRNVPRECAVAASLIRPLTAAAVRDEALSWPTCDEGEQREMRRRLGLHGVVARR
jgi:hypothetical protein